MSLRKIAILLTALLAGGCVSDSNPANVSADAPQGQTAKEDSAYHQRSLCQATSVAGEAKTVCY